MADSQTDAQPQPSPSDSAEARPSREKLIAATRQMQFTDDESATEARPSREELIAATRRMRFGDDEGATGAIDTSATDNANRASSNENKDEKNEENVEKEKFDGPATSTAKIFESNQAPNAEKTNLSEEKAMPTDDAEGNAATSAHANMVKDENGFVYYRCRFCGLTFNFMTTLKAHERVHDVMQPYLCNKCGESFHYMCELEYHAKSHLKQKGYKCDCGRTFYQYTDLLYHKHPGEDPDPIFPMPATLPQIQPSKSGPIDPAEFPTPEYMEKGFEPKHPMKVYSEVRSKPYICQYCSKSYADSRGLAYHMYSHRGEKIFNPRASRYLMCRNENSYISPGAPL